MPWDTIFESPGVRIQADCQHPWFHVRLQLLGDPQHYAEGIRSEHVRRFACTQASDVLWIIDHAVIDRSSGEYVPRGRWEDSERFDGLLTTQTLAYAELPEEDPEGDYQVTASDRVADAANPQNVHVDNVYQFKMTRRALVDVLDAVGRRLRACCAAEIGMRPPRERERHA